LQYTNPALEFSKMICTSVFGLDPVFEHPASSLKRSLLTLINQKEFSPEAIERNEPSLILVIPDVICESCLSVRDLDICRDEGITRGESIEEADWRCKSCDSPLDKVHIERRLVELLNRRVVTYQMQDLKCKGCKMINNNLVSRHCTCTGTFLQTVGN